MTPTELERYLHLTTVIAHHEQALDAAVKEKQQLARTLYERCGRHAVYRIGEGEQQKDLTVARTKVGTYYFTPRVRYPKESRYGKAEQKRLDRAARMQRFPTQASVARPQPLAETAAALEGPIQAEIDAAMKRGRRDRDRATAERAAKLAPYNEQPPKHRLPIVGDVDQPFVPETRLLEIQEPSGALLGDSGKPD